MSDTVEKGQLTATFVFVDLAGYTALTEAHGDADAADLAVVFKGLVEDSLADAGRLAKLMGDAALLVCPRPGDALEGLERLLDRVGALENFPEIRVGLAHGSAVERDGDVFGAGVNLAARIASHARGGQVLGTREIADAARERGTASEALGPVALRNLRRPVELFSILLARGEQPEAVEIDPVCRMRVAPERAAGKLSHDGRAYWFCSLRCAAMFAESPQAYVSH